MATYYYKVLETVTNHYRGLHNLYILDQTDKKIQCYKQFSNKPHQYYECFNLVEKDREDRARLLELNYKNIQDQYKLASEGCRNMLQFERNHCNKSCGKKFEDEVKVLYDNFYTKLNGRREYKKVKK